MTPSSIPLNICVSNFGFCLPPPPTPLSYPVKNYLFKIICHFYWSQKKTILRHFPCFQLLKHHGKSHKNLLLARSGLFPSTAPILVSGRVPGENISFKAAPPKKKQPPCHFFRYTRGKNNDDPYISIDVSLSLWVCCRWKKNTCHFQKHSETFVAPGGVVLKLAHIHVHCIENLKKNTHTFRRYWCHKFQKGKKKNIDIWPKRKVSQWTKIWRLNQLGWAKTPHFCHEICWPLYQLVKVHQILSTWRTACASSCNRATVVTPKDWLTSMTEYWQPARWATSASPEGFYGWLKNLIPFSSTEKKQPDWMKNFQPKKNKGLWKKVSVSGSFFW